MGKQYLSSIRQTARQVLRDEFNVDTAANIEWQDDELDVIIGKKVRAISKVRPYMVKEVKTTIANSKVLDISAITDLLWIEKAEYKTGQSPRAFRNIIELDAEQVELDTSLTPSAGASSTLTGTVTFASGSAAVTGSGTLFTTELAAGYHIKKAVAGATGRWYRIYSITDATHLVLAEPCMSGDNGADTASATHYCYEAAYLYCAKLHTLTEDISTLTPSLEELLVIGVAGEAAVNRARSLVDKVNVGGGGAPSAMEAWGLRRLAEFEDGLKAIRKSRINKTYSRD